MSRKHFIQGSTNCLIPKVSKPSWCPHPVSSRFWQTWDQLISTSDSSSLSEFHCYFELSSIHNLYLDMYQSADCKYQRFISFPYHISIASFQEVSAHLSHSESQVDGTGTIWNIASCCVEGKRVLQYLSSTIKYLTPKWHA